MLLDVGRAVASSTRAGSGVVTALRLGLGLGLSSLLIVGIYVVSLDMATRLASGAVTIR